MVFGDTANCRNHTWLAIEEREYREEVASVKIFCHRTILQVDTRETDCSKRHKIDYETCTNMTEVSQQKCTICKVCSYFFGLFQEPTNESALDWTCI